MVLTLLTVCGAIAAIWIHTGSPLWRQVIGTAVLSVVLVMFLLFLVLEFWRHDAHA
jgi:hypothetical protein